MNFLRQQDLRCLAALSLGLLLVTAGCALDSGRLRTWRKNRPDETGTAKASVSGKPEMRMPPAPRSPQPLNSNGVQHALATESSGNGLIVQSSYASTLIVDSAETQIGGPGPQFEGLITPENEPPVPSLIETEPAPESVIEPPITMHFDDLEVRKALELLSRESTMNVLVSPGVTGKVTADLKGVTFDQALDAVLKLCNLVARRENQIVYIYTPAELNEIAEQEKHGPQGTRVYRLNYVRSEDIASMITPFLSERGRLSSTPPSSVGIDGGSGGSGGGQGGGSGGGSSGGASGGGSGGSSGGSGGGGSSGGAGGGSGGGGSPSGGDAMAGGDFVVVQDSEAVLKTIDRLIEQLDVQPVQVLIEAVIMTVTRTNTNDLGVNYAVLDGAGRVLASVGSGAAINAAAGFDPTQVLSAGSPLATIGTTLATAGGKLAGSSSTGFAESANGARFGFVDNDLTGFIRALETVGETNVLASPRLLVLNKQRAELQLGDRLGFRTLTQTQTSTVQKVEFMNVGTQLYLRPFISSDGMVRMEIHPERSSGSVIDNIPQTSTSQLTTNVMVPDGCTIVIGGLMENVDDTQMSGIPGLSRLPVIGALFRQKTSSITKKELVVLLTPRIWKPHGEQPQLPNLTHPNMAPPMSMLPPVRLPTPELSPSPNLVPNDSRAVPDLIMPLEP